jgi:uncharacterized protein YgiM (DUF1202 family)
MKKTIAIFLTLAVFAAVFTPLTTAYAMPYFEDGTITGDNVNMRMRPTTDSPSILMLKEGDRVGVFCEEVDGWYRIIYGNYRGYINSKFVFLPSANYKIGHVIEGGLNLRQNPGTYSNVIATLDAGTGVTITDISGDWYYIEVDVITQETETEPTTDDYEDEPLAQDVLKGYVQKDKIQLSSGDKVTTLLKKGM